MLEQGRRTLVLRLQVSANVKNNDHTLIGQMVHMVEEEFGSVEVTISGLEVLPLLGPFEAMAPELQDMLGRLKDALPKKEGWQDPEGT